jgi:molecular chaperone DnaJ
MTPLEAYTILGLSETATDEELKAKHKELVFTYHPDRNKTADPNKLSEINSAMQLIQDARQNPHKYQPQSNGFNVVDLGGIGDIFSSFFGQNNRSTPRQSNPPPTVDITISFRESVLGTDKTITYKRMSKCAACDGKGLEFLSNGCTSCNGFGKVIQNRPGMSVQTICSKCQGRNVQNKKCAVCNVKGCIEQEVSTSVKVPAGVPNDIVMELAHAGHYGGNNSLFGGDTYTSVHIRVHVEPSEGLELVGQDVISRLTIPLVEALTGTKHIVPSIDGPKEIVIEPLTRHQQEIILPSLGVSGKGNQRVIVNVEYPADVSKLIEALKG